MEHKLYTKMKYSFLKVYFGIETMVGKCQ